MDGRMKKDDKIIEEARQRFSYAQEYWGEQRADMLDDLRFSDPTDPRQWPDEVRRARETAKHGARPCLTFDRTNQFINQVVNDARQNKPSIKLIPMDSGSDPRLAEVLQGMFRQIEYTSRAGVAYDTAIASSARCGVGWLRVVTEVEDDETNEQCLKIKRIPNVFSVYFDPDSTEPDGQDGLWAIVWEDIPRKVFEKRWPKVEASNWDFDDSGWATKDTVRIAEYFRIVETKKNVIKKDDKEYEEDDFWEEYQAGKVDQEGVETEVTVTRRCEWYKLTAGQVLEKSEFPSEFLPIIPVIGDESFVEGKRKFSGLVRRAKDPQRSYNYERSAFIERVALAPKAPFLAASESIEGFENHWSRANADNLSYLPFNAYTDDGKQLPFPQRTAPASIESGWASAAQQSLGDLQAAFGMFEANLGQKSNETSGKAILARQREGDTATFHYVDNLAISIAQLGRVILQAIPRIYDTQRVVRILGEDEVSQFVRVEPMMTEAYRESGNEILINPSVGEYDIAVKVGPAYTTRRQESAEAISQLVNGNPQLLAMLGDEWVKLMDWPNAEKMSQRFKAMLPPEIRQAEAGENAEVQAVIQQAQQSMQAMQQQLQQMDAALKATTQDKRLEVARLQLDREKVAIDREKAETDRMKAQAEIVEKVALPMEQAAALGVSNEQQQIAMAQIAAVVQGFNQMAEQSMMAVRDQLAQMAQKPQRQFQFQYDEAGNVIGAMEQ